MIIKASLRSFRRRELSAADLREAADDIGHEVDRLNRIVADVLDFARPIDIEVRPTDLNVVCRSSTGLTPTASAKPTGGRTPTCPTGMMKPSTPLPKEL
jgi:hypothetical protein